VEKEAKVDRDSPSDRHGIKLLLQGKFGPEIAHGGQGSEDGDQLGLLLSGSPKLRLGMGTGDSKERRPK
jgi:hypothetical protein